MEVVAVVGVGPLKFIHEILQAVDITYVKKTTP